MCPFSYFHLNFLFYCFYFHHSEKTNLLGNMLYFFLPLLSASKTYPQLGLKSWKNIIANNRMADTTSIAWCVQKIVYFSSLKSQSYPIYWLNWTQLSQLTLIESQQWFFLKIKKQHIIPKLQAQRLLKDLLLPSSIP